MTFTNIALRLDDGSLFWENSVDRRYSEIRYLRRRIQESAHLFITTPLPKIPKFIHIRALFNHRLEESDISKRCIAIEAFLNSLSEHLITRSTPYFEQFFNMPIPVIILWIK